MSSNTINIDVEFQTIEPQDSPHEMAQVKQLLEANNLQLDALVELFAIGRAQGRIIACAGLYHNTVKCVAIDHKYRGESLSLRLGSEVTNLAAQRGQFHLFLYSAPHNIQFFRGWGFYPLVEVPDLVVLMENSPIAIKSYCDKLSQHRRPGKKIGGIVLNANPFTLGHRYLVEKAAGECDWLHVFVVREDASVFAYADRFQLVSEGVKDIENLTLYPGSEYIISRATFPGYFLKEKQVIDQSWTAIDLLLFREYIAPALGITHRFVGTEPFDQVTNRYNQDMKTWLEKAAAKAPSISVVEVPRAAIDDTAISATEVRRLLAERDFARIGKLVPPTTLQFLEKKFPLETSAIQ
jgi:[citrate (pro-3S)-lyase] ligase